MKKKRRAKNKIIPLLLIIFFICCALITPSNLFAQGVQSSKIPPEKWGKKPPERKPPLPSQIVGISPDPAKLFQLPPLDIDTLRAEDEANRSSDKPLRDAVSRPINASPLTHGEWFDIDEGKGSIWLFQIHTPSAAGINVHFTDVNLPKGARVYVYSPSYPDKYAGPYRKGPEFFSKLIVGDTVTIELAIPTPYTPDLKPPFIIKEIGHMYRPLRQKTMSDFGITPLAGLCHNDATCPEYSGWATEGDFDGSFC